MPRTYHKDELKLDSKNGVDRFPVKLEDSVEFVTLHISRTSRIVVERSCRNVNNMCSHLVKLQHILSFTGTTERSRRTCFAAWPFWFQEYDEKTDVILPEIKVETFSLFLTSFHIIRDTNKEAVNNNLSCYKQPPMS